MIEGWKEIEFVSLARLIWRLIPEEVRTRPELFGPHCMAVISDPRSYREVIDASQKGAGE